MSAPSTSKRTFWQDDSAQAMVMGALSMFFILPMVALVYNVSQLTNRRIVVQQAADAAAYSGALIEANTLSSLAVTNEAMAYTYYGMMRQAVDLIATGVVAEFEARGAPPNIVGLPNALQHYDDARSSAETWIPRGERWLNRLSVLNRTVARITPTLMMQEVAQVAKENGAIAATVFPKPSFVPQAGFTAFYYIERLDDGWRITNDSGYLLEIVEADLKKWEVTDSSLGKLVFEHLGEEHWKITKGHFEADLHTDAVTYLRLDLTDLPHGGVGTHVEAEKIFEGGWELKMTGPDFGMHVLPHRDGTFQIDISSPEVNYSEHVKWDEDNRLMVERGGQWEYLPDQEPEMTIDGEVIDVNYIRRITFPGGRFDPPNNITFHGVTFRPPNHLSIPGLHIVIEPGLVTLFGRHGPVSYRINTDVHFDINRLTINDGDSRWRYLDDRTRHRLIQDTEDHWTYELRREPSDLIEENPLRFGYHAVMDNDPDANTPGGFVMPRWTEWFRVEAGASLTPEAYYQTRPCWSAVCDHLAGSRSSRSCRYCGGRDLDGDGLTDVRIYQYEVEQDRLDPYHRIDLFSLPAPLRISEAFWKLGVNVAVWAPGPKTILGHRGIRHRFFPFFRKAPAGLFAVASARAGFLYRYETGAGRVEERLLHNFDTPDEALQWSQTGYQCLYEPVWTAKLVPVAENVRSSDIGALAPDSGTAFLFRALKQRAWREVASPEEFARGRTRYRGEVRHAFRIFRNRRGRVLDTDAPEFSEILHH